jgi:hypothetical protein
MLDYLADFNFSRSVTVGECMGDPPQNWYRTAGGAANHTLLVRHQSIAQRQMKLADKTQLHRSLGSALQCSTLLLIGGQFLAMLFS